MVLRLVEAGAQVNAQSIDTGYTPLIWAAQHGNIEAVRILLHYGAKPELRDKWGQTALDKCTQKPEIAALLTNAMSPEQTQQLQEE